MWLRIWSSALLGVCLLAHAGERFVYEVTYSGVGRDEKVRHESIYQETDGQRLIVFERVYKVSTNELVSSEFRPPRGAMTRYTDGVPNQREIVAEYVSKSGAPEVLAGDSNKVDPTYIYAGPPKHTGVKIFFASGAAFLVLIGFWRVFRRV